MQSFQLDSLIKIFSFHKKLGLDALYDRRLKDSNLNQNDAIKKEGEDQIDTKMEEAVNLVSSNAEVKLM